MRMNARARVGAFVALLAAVFAGAALVGGALDPDGGGGDEHATATATTHDAATATTAPGADHGDAHDGDEPAADAAAGVASAHGGLRLVVERKRFTADRAGPLRFRIVDDGGETVREFDLEQARRMHVIVVRRDLRRYQHLHPTDDGDGAWTTSLTLPEAGVYRAFADFSSGGEQHTLGVDLFVGGRFDPLELPPATDSTGIDGYDVALREQPGGELSFAVSRDGSRVADLQPYLGARGHLVMLREGDLAYLHMHPLDSAPDRIAFHTGTPEPATYRLFLQFRHRDRVHTVAFTRVVER